MSVNPFRKDPGAGSRGGRVPPMTLTEAQAIFEKFRKHEYGWVRAKILYLAREKGEFHGDMLADVELEQRNVIGAAVNALAKSNLIASTGEHRKPESKTSRRASYVYALTERGEILLAEMDRQGGITKFNQPKGRKEMDLKKAKALVALALENEVLEGDAPNEDSQIIAEAEGLVENAITAWNKNIRGPEVESLLMLDANWDEMDASDQEAAAGKFANTAPPADDQPSEEDKSNPFAKKAAKKDEPKEEPASDPDPEPDPEPEPESEGDGKRVVPTAESIEAAKERIIEAAKDGDPDDDDYYDPEGDVAPFEDYDKVKVAEFKAAFANEWDAEQIAVVQLYEASHKGRPGIVNWTPDKAPKDAPADQPPADDTPSQEDSKPASEATVSGSITITREQILEALRDGAVTVTAS